jgi:N-acetylneuraminic acid mutarotase
MNPLMILALAAFFQAPAFAAGLLWEPIPPLPEKLGVAAPFAGASAGALLVAGGANFPAGMPWEGGAKAWTDRVWRLQGGEWTEAGSLPGPRAYGVSAGTPRGVVCVGGSDEARHFADGFRLSMHGGRLAVELLPQLPLPLANHCGAVLGGTLFITGGAEFPGEQSASQRFLALDLDAAGASWKELEPLPGPARILAAAGVCEGAFFVFGGAALESGPSGKAGRRYLRDAWRYSPGSGWKPLADMPRPLAAVPSPAPFVGGAFVLLPGDDGSLAGFSPADRHPGFSRTITRYDPVRDLWSVSGEAPVARVTAPCVEWGDGFVVPSGEVRPGVRSPEVWSFKVK